MKSVWKTSCLVHCTSQMLYFYPFIHLLPYIKWQVPLSLIRWVLCFYKGFHCWLKRPKVSAIMHYSSFYATVLAGISSRKRKGRPEIEWQRALWVIQILWFRWVRKSGYWGIYVQSSGMYTNKIEPCHTKRGVKIVDVVIIKEGLVILAPAQPSLLLVWHRICNCTPDVFIDYIKIRVKYLSCLECCINCFIYKQTLHHCNYKSTLHYIPHKNFYYYI